MTASHGQNATAHRVGAVPGRPEAAAVAWGRFEGKEAAESGAGRGRLVAQAALVALMAAAIGAFVSRTAGVVLFGIGALVFTAAMISPRTVSSVLEGLFAAAGRVVGTGLTWLLMIPLFYLFFLPFGVLFRRGRRDRLKRFLDPDARSYWEPHEGPRAGSLHHDRQY